MPRTVALFDLTNDDAIATDLLNARDAVARYPARWTLSPPAGTLKADGSPLVAPSEGLRIPGPVGPIPPGDPRRAGPFLERCQGGATARGIYERIPDV